MRFIVAFGRFWYDFIVGDDWRIAAGVTLVLACGAFVEAVGLGGEWLPAALAVGLAVVFALPLVADSGPSTTGGEVVPATGDRLPAADQDGLA